ncbi:phosphatidylinositol-specific phospholipase C [Kitasatospora mediocidica]|uniref:phosphatidylinositol-specific phospholipase C n=1 Tax=Kitasatospora mediocidica TaxID=58352 RepID=UPI000567C606|nr:phosphatidylinositol-specific phospholipase C [Kitasatospora mediocidica]
MDLTGTRISRRTFARSALVLGAAGLGLARAATPARADVLPAGSDWMGALPGGGYLSQLTVPGTHDTGSRYGGALTQTQTLAVPDQLAAGVRFLDVRCRAINGVFAIHHGPVFQQIFFGDVLNACQDFLAQHPGESVLMRVKQEYSTVSDADFAAIFAGYQAKWSGLFWAENRIPQLGEVRGRVVLLADSSGLPGIPWGGASTDIEDDYDIGTIFEIASRKWPEVSAHFDAARASADPQKLYITFTTSSGWGLWPQQAAEAMAPRIGGYLGGLNAAARPLLGTVPMDFVTAGSVQPFYALNFGL